MNRIKPAQALVAFGVASRFVANRINKNRTERVKLVRSLSFENELLRAALDASDERSSYLIRKLTEAGVPCDEYDLIVLNNLIQ